jgi:hypothetical protein
MRYGHVSGATLLILSLREEIINIEVVRFLLSAGACMGDLDDPALNSCAKAFIQEEVQKLEVLACTFIIILFSGFDHLAYMMPHFMCVGGSNRACDAGGATHRTLRYCEARWGVHGVAWLDEVGLRLTL